MPDSTVLNVVNDAADHLAGADLVRLDHGLAATGCHDPIVRSRLGVGDWRCDGQ
jgi:hypothetical protein